MDTWKRKYLHRTACGIVNLHLSESRGAHGFWISCSHILSFTVQGNSAAAAATKDAATSGPTLFRPNCDSFSSFWVPPSESTGSTGRDRERWRELDRPGALTCPMFTGTLDEVSTLRAGGKSNAKTSGLIPWIEEKIPCMELFKDNIGCRLACLWPINHPCKHGNAQGAGSPKGKNWWICPASTILEGAWLPVFPKDIEEWRAGMPPMPDWSTGISPTVSFWEIDCSTISSALSTMFCEFPGEIELDCPSKVSTVLITMSSFTLSISPGKHLDDESLGTELAPAISTGDISIGTTLSPCLPKPEVDQSCFWRKGSDLCCALEEQVNLLLLPGLTILSSSCKYVPPSLVKAGNNM